jgi:hypothetical protein
MDGNQDREAMTADLAAIVVNTWVNRLIGDQQSAGKDARTPKSDNGMLGGKPQRTGTPSPLPATTTLNRRNPICSAP